MCEKCRVLSKRDLCKDFHQVEMEESANNSTTFLCPLGRLRYRIMPFVLCNATSYLSSINGEGLAGMEYCAVYIDDVLVF